MQENLSVVLKGAKDLHLENRPIPKPKAGEVQIAIKTVGICTSDVHFYLHGGIGDRIIKSPMVMGHEGAGLVTCVGKGVTNFKVGDRVTIEPGVPCSRCKHCKSGRYNLCQQVRFCATPTADGNLCQFYCQSADFIHKIPETMTWTEAALCEPVSCAVSACKRAGVSLGHNILIIGAGPIGLLVAMVARSLGACKIVLADIAPSRLEFAKAILKSDTEFVVVDCRATPKETASLILDKVDQLGIDITIECSGSQSAIQTAIYATKNGGVAMLVGMGSPVVKIPISEVVGREIEIRGMFRYVNCYPTAISLIASGKVDAVKLVTHYVPLQDGIQAFETAANSASSGAVKVIVTCENNKF